MGGYQRRRDDWVLQSNLAVREIAGVDKQILAAQIRIQVAKYELASHEKQIENARKADELMRSKYTNRQLYQWMQGQIRQIYFQAYQLAYDAAQRAERAYRFELSVGESSFIRPNYFDRLRKGLLSGESLYHDLKRMEMAYLEANQREYELTRHISLLQINPLALVTLRQTGVCEFSIPEALFDLELPGHYMRRIRSVSLSMPCITGPYTGVHARLTLRRSALRRNALLRNGQYARDVSDDDPRFDDDFGANQSIVTSVAQMDSGLFETNLRDERYLPFEGAGVISEWKLELPAQFRQFDYSTISDVILHIRYTAREGGSVLRSGAIAHIQQLVRAEQMAGTVRLFSVRHEFPTEWAKFQSQKATANRRAALVLALREEHYPLWSKGLRSRVTSVELFAKSSRVTPPKELIIADDVAEDRLSNISELNGLLNGAFDNIALPATPTAELKLYFDDNALEDLWIVVTWSA
jgi:hypothetical protein